MALDMVPVTQDVFLTQIHLYNVFLQASDIWVRCTKIDALIHRIICRTKHSDMTMDVNEGGIDVED
jgi:hypothetical protein